VIEFALHPEQQLVKRRQFWCRRLILWGQDCCVHVACKLYSKKTSCYPTCNKAHTSRPFPTVSHIQGGKQQKAKAGKIQKELACHHTTRPEGNRPVLGESTVCGPMCPRHRMTQGRQTTECEGWEDPERIGSTSNDETWRKSACLGRKHKSAPLTEKIDVNVWPDVSQTRDDARQGTASNSAMPPAHCRFTSSLPTASTDYYPDCFFFWATLFCFSPFPYFFLFLVLCDRSSRHFISFCLHTNTSSHIVSYLVFYLSFSYLL